MDETQPLMLPYYHFGLHEVLRVGSLLPNRGQRLRMAFGDVWDPVSEVNSVDDDGAARWERLSTLAHARLRSRSTTTINDIVAQQGR